VKPIRHPLMADARTWGSPGIIRVPVADDHTIVLEGIISLLL
jgi:hypothetical protein